MVAVKHAVSKKPRDMCVTQDSVGAEPLCSPVPPKDVHSHRFECFKPMPTGVRPAVTLSGTFQLPPNDGAPIRERIAKMVRDRQKIMQSAKQSTELFCRVTNRNTGEKEEWAFR